MESDGNRLVAGIGITQISIIMGVVSVLIPLIDEMLEVDLFQPLPWPFLLFIVAGAWASYASSIRSGALLGAAMGLLMTAMRGIVMPLLGLPVPIEERPRVGFYMGLIAVIGILLGTLGGLPVWVVKNWRGSRASA